jgi:lipoate-protein ligase B
MKWSFLGRVSYADAVELQERIRNQILDGKAEDQLLLLEHDPVVTLGRGAKPGDILQPERLTQLGIAVEKSSRGGQVTYHGPGQLVAYPVMRIASVVAHVEALCGAAVDVAADFGIAARYRRDCPGVWVDGRKLASVGVHVHRRVAMHGLALNVSTALEPFSLIVACGMAGARPTSIALESGRSATVADIAGRFAEAFAGRLSRSPLHSAAPSVE